MKKDAYFFPHYCNARHDRKLKRVIKELGVEGYGIYFMLLEVLREQVDFRYPLEDLDLLADEFGTSEQKIRTVICNYKLFDVDENENFFSIKLVFYLQPYIEKSQRARDAANLRWSNAKLQIEHKTDANAYANAEQMQSDSNADAMQGEYSKGEETKIKENSGRFTPPTLEEISEYIKSKGYSVNAERFVNYYGSIDWKVGKNKMKDWKKAVATWQTKEQPNAVKKPNVDYSTLGEESKMWND